MSTRARTARQKLSTTVAPETYAYFESLIRSGNATSVGDAVDAVVKKARRLENRLRLARDTAAYFDHLSPAARQEEQELATELPKLARGIDYDREP